MRSNLSRASDPDLRTGGAEAGGKLRDGELARFLGYSIEELMGVRLMDRVHPEDRSLAEARARGFAKDSAEVGLELRVESADGEWVPMRWSLAQGPDGRVYGVGRDIMREFRHREAQLSQQMAELRLATAMELHDGILQILTGAAFQIAAAQRVVRQDPARAEEVLAELAQSVSAEQRELRLFVDEIKGETPSSRWGRGTRGTRG